MTWRILIGYPTYLVSPIVTGSNLSAHEKRDSYCQKTGFGEGREGEGEGTREKKKRCWEIWNLSLSAVISINLLQVAIVISSSAMDFLPTETPSIARRHGFRSLKLVSVSMDDLLGEIPVGVDYGRLENGLSYYVRSNSKPKMRAALSLAVKVG